GSGLLLPMGGRLLDRWGLRKCAVLASVTLALALFFLAQCDRIAHGLARNATETALWTTTFIVIAFGFFLLRFSGQGMLTMTCRNMVGKWFHHRRGLAIGISGVAVALLFSASPSILNTFVEQFGWRETWIGMGFILLFGIS